MRVKQRRVIHILAYIKLVEPDRSIMGKGDVLGVDQVTSDRRSSRVL